MIRSRPAPACPVCQAAAVPLYSGLRDTLYSAPGEWDVARCPAPRCGTLWLNPTPLAEDLHEAYESYMTHAADSAIGQSRLRRAKHRVLCSYLRSRYAPDRRSVADRLLAPWLYLLPGHRWDADVMVYGLTPVSGGRILEVGCGDGKKLEWLEFLGWRAEGLDVDEKVVEIARSRNRSVHQGDLFSGRYADQSFEAVVMSHVIEHVADPTAVIRECRRILTKGGRLVLLTPNAGSWGHRLYGSHWLPLDVPRHLQVFTSSSLSALCEGEGFRIERARSTPRSRAVFLSSRRIARDGRMDFKARIGLGSRLWMEGMETLEWLRLFVEPHCGEELHLTAVKD